MTGKAAEEIKRDSSVKETIVFSRLRRSIDKFSLPIFTECQKKLFYVTKEYIHRDARHGNIKSKIYFPTGDNLRYAMREIIMKKLIEKLIVNKEIITMDDVKKITLAVTGAFKHRNPTINKHVKQIALEVVKNAYMLFEIINPNDFKGEELELNVEIECDFYQFMENRIKSLKRYDEEKMLRIFANVDNGTISMKSDYPAVIRLNEKQYNIVFFSNVNLEGINLRNASISTFIKMIRHFIKNLEMDFEDDVPALRDIVIYDLIGLKRYYIDGEALNGKLQEKDILNMVKVIKLGLMTRCFNGNTCKLCTNEDICSANTLTPKASFQYRFKKSTKNLITNEVE